MKVFVSSSNMAEKMFAAARAYPQYAPQFKAYGDDIDIAVEAYILSPTKLLFENMLKEIEYAGRLYKVATGRELKAD
jgi:hypothetical protein